MVEASKSEIKSINIVGLTCLGQVFQGCWEGRETARNLELLKINQCEPKCNVSG